MGIVAILAPALQARRRACVWVREYVVGAKTTSAAHILLMAVAHNLRTLARVRAAKEMRVFVILMIYSTNSIATTTF